MKFGTSMLVAVAMAESHPWEEIPNSAKWTAGISYKF